MACGEVTASEETELEARSKRDPLPGFASWAVLATTLD